MDLRNARFLFDVIREIWRPIIAIFRRINWLKITALTRPCARQINDAPLALFRDIRVARN